MSSVKKNFIYNSFSSILFLIVPLITTPYVSRVLGPNGLGEYSYSYSIAAYFVTLIMLGLNNYGNRTIASCRDSKEESSKAFFEIYAMQFIGGLFFLLIYVLYVIFIAKRVVSWIMVFFVLSAMFDINWFFSGLELFKLTVTRSVIIKIFTTVCIFIFVNGKNDTWKYALIISTGMLISQVSIWPFLRKYICFTKVTYKGIKQHIKPNLVLFIPAIAVSIYKLMDKIMLGMFTTMEEVGIYEAAEKLIQIPNALVVSLGTVMLPRMSNLYAKNRSETMNAYMEKSIEITMLFSVSMSLGIMAVSEQLVPIFFGNGYEKCIILLQFIMPSCIFVGFANVIRTEYLIPHRYDQIYIKSVFGGAIVNFIINLFLIRPLGSIGVAIGTLLAEMTVCVYQTYSIRREVNIRLFIFKSINVLLAGIIMYICVQGLTVSRINNSYVRLILRIILGIITFGAIIFIEYIYEKWRKNRY